MTVSPTALGAAVRPHCGPSNHRLRLHLPLLVPKRCKQPSRAGQQGTAGIRVAGEVRRWRRGAVLVFDDGFEHEVWHSCGGQAARLVLIVDVWQPWLSQGDREAIRRRMRWGDGGA